MTRSTSGNVATPQSVGSPEVTPMAFVAKNVLTSLARPVWASAARYARSGACVRSATSFSARYTKRPRAVRSAMPWAADTSARSRR